MKKLIKSIAKPKALAISQAKVIRVSGEIEYHYSIPKVAWYNIKGRLWLNRRLKAMKAEEII